MLILVKNIESLSYDHQGSGVYLHKATYSYSVSRVKTGWQELRTPLYYSKAEKYEDFFQFKFFKNILTIYHNLDQKLLSYTEVYHVHHIGKIEYDSEYKVYRLEDNQKIRFVYNGPDELALQWKLSI